MKVFEWIFRASSTPASRGCKYLTTLMTLKSHKYNKNSTRVPFSSSKLTDMENEIFLPFPFFRSLCPPHSFVHFSFPTFFASSLTHLKRRFKDDAEKLAHSLANDDLSLVVKHGI